jgi:hypothetical protein
MALFKLIDVSGARACARDRTRRFGWRVLLVVTRHAVRVWLEAPTAMPGQHR